MDIKIKSIRDYLSLEIEIFFLMHLSTTPDKKLRPTEKRAFIEFILLSLKKQNIDSLESKEHIRDYMGWNSDTDVWQYKNKLKNKGWLIKDNIGQWRIRDEFNFFIKKFKPNASYVLNISYIGAIKKSI